MKLISVLLLLLAPCYSKAQCDGKSEILPNIHQRSISDHISSSIYHDYYIPEEGKWYSTEGYDILNQSDIVGNNIISCGNTYGIWVNGELPKYPGETVVLITYSSYDNPTDHPINVTMCNNGRNEYYLYPVNHPYVSYCFEKSEKTKFQPSFVKVDFFPKSGSSQILEYECQFEKDSNKDTHYQVYWIVNDVFEILSRNFTLDGDEDIKNFTRYRNTDQSKMLNINIKCGVLVHEEATVNAFLSDSFFAGIKVNEPIIYHNINDDKPVIINLTLTIPLTCGDHQECKLPIALNTFGPNEPFCANEKDRPSCFLEIVQTNYTLKPYHEFDVILEKEISYSSKAYEEYYVQLSAFPANDVLWKDLTVDPIKIIVHDSSNLWKGKRCFSHNDPHILTFDGRYYDHQIRHTGYDKGNYVLYRQESWNKVNMVEIALAECSSGILCNCGVAIRSGADVFKIDLCFGKRKIHSAQCHDQQLKIYSRDLTFYQVLLPTGTLVEVYVGWNFLSVDIIASPADVNSSTGLCGLLNGICTDDFVLRDGTFTSNTQQANDSNCGGGFHYGYPDFSQSYRVTGTSLFEDDLNIPPSNNSKKYCPCTAKPSESRSECGKYRVFSCSIEKYAKKTFCKIEDKSIRRRKKRSTGTTFKSYEDVGRTKRSTEDAYADCKEFMESSEAFVACQKILPVQANATIEECAADVQLTDSIFWRNQSHNNFINACFGEVLLNNTLTASNNSEQIVLVNTITALLCPGNPICSGNGDCIDRKCVCHYGFIGSDCSSSFSEPPEIQNLRSEGICDISKASCQNIYVIGFEFYDSPNMTCKLEYFKIHHNLSWIFTNDPVSAIVNQETFVEIACPIPTSRAINISENILAHGYMISLSYDGINYSDEHDYFIYDGTCVEHIIMANDNVSFLLQKSFCFIDGVCYDHGQKNQRNPNLLCDTSFSQEQWTVTTNMQLKIDRKESKNWLLPVVVSVVLFVVLGMASAVIFCKVFKKNKGIYMIQPMPFPQKNDQSKAKRFQHFTSTFDHSVTDLHNTLGIKK